MDEVLFGFRYLLLGELEDTVIMKDEADNEKLLIRYLLGSLPEELKLQVEGEFLNNEMLQ
jgi:hypothetical protein